MASYDTEEAVFTNLIRSTEELTDPEFRNYYLEAKTFNDTFPGTNVNHFGKKKFMSTLSNEVRRFSSVTYSDKNDYSTKRLRFTSFNAYNAPFKDLPNEHGNINVLLNFSDSLFVVQENKASAVPVSRNILSDALGQDTLIGSDSILGTQKFYAGGYGSDNNPESVVQVDNNIYFAHKSRGEVYRFNPSNGVQVISQKGMNAFFRDAFQDAITAGGQIRIVSGYDPLKDEYLITIANFATLTNPDATQYTQLGLQQPISVPGGTTAEDTGGISDPINELINGILESSGDVDDTVGLITDLQNTQTDMPFATNEDYSISDVDGQIIVDMSGLFSAAVAAALGTFNVQALSSGNALPFGQFNPVSNTILVTNPNLTAQGVIGQMNASLTDIGISAGQYAGISHEDPLGDKMLQEAVNIRFFEKQDTKALQVFAIKSEEEKITSQILGIQNDINTLTTQVQSINSSGVISQSNAYSMLGLIEDSYALLTSYAFDSLGALSEEDAVSYTFNSSFLGTQTYTGFSQFEFNEYPLDSLDINLLQGLLTRMVNLETLIIGLQSLDGVDAIVYLQGINDENALLRGQIDVLTAQIQNLSAAPPGSPTLIENIAPGQLTSQTIEVLAGSDATLDFTDLRPVLSFNTQIQGLLDGLSSSGVPITPDVVRSVIAGYANNISNESSTIPFFAFGAGSAVLPIVSSESDIDGNPIYTNEDLVQLTQVATRNKTGNAPADLNNNSNVDVGDVLLLLSAFGASISGSETFDLDGDPEIVDSVINNISESYGG